MRWHRNAAKKLRLDVRNYFGADDVEAYYGILKSKRLVD